MLKMILLILVLFFSGCSLRDAYQDQKVRKQYGTITGKVEHSESTRTVVLLRDTITNNILDAYALEGLGSYLFVAPLSNYTVEIFLDKNHDGIHQPEYEDSAHSAPFSLNSTSEVRLPTLIPKKSNKKVPENIQEILLKSTPEHSVLEYTIDTVADLNSPIFSPEKGHEGMWTPVAFLKHNTTGIYFTEPPVKGKKLVLFIHGINGTPANFSTLINAVDRTKFQPCFAFYPSGAKLSIISQYIVRWLNALQIKYNYNEVVIVAHSMGGLVAKATLDELIKDHQRSSKSINPRGFITYATPWGGFPIANGLEHSPVVLESWRNLASGSPFLTKLYSTPIPANVPFTLVFGYNNGGRDISGDGTVPHSSQLHLPIQTQAAKIIGVNANHDDVLVDELSLKTLSHFLETSQQKNTL